jgi:ABC-type multidrug transport system fused ATPase/permease subunit
MDAGKVIEIGSHSELMELGGQYARLYQLGLRDVSSDSI